MHTLIFATKEEDTLLRNLLNGVSISKLEHIAERLWFLEVDDCEDRVIICVGEEMTFGWAIYGEFNVVFSAGFSTDRSTREQARGRVRPKRTVA